MRPAAEAVEPHSTKGGCASPKDNTATRTRRKNRPIAEFRFSSVEMWLF
jgi:hypothetical protein